MSRTARCITVAERRARLGRRHCLAATARAAEPVTVAERLVALHATDPSTVYLSACLRTQTRQIKQLERALYDERHLVRMLGMRRTMFVVPAALVPTVHAACTQSIAALERRRTVQLLEAAGLASDGARWLADVEHQTLEALDTLGEATASELAERVPGLRERVRMAEGKSYAGWLGLSTRVLFLLAAQGQVVRGRPRGSWTSGQYRWAPRRTWLREPAISNISVEAAQAELVRRWLASFGPGTLADLRWWTGLGAREIQRALATLSTVEVDLDGTPGLVLEDDVEPVATPEPWVALLPALDPTPMGWGPADRSWFLGQHGPALFDASGNIGPSVWCDGRIVGGWAQRKSGRVVLRLLDDVGTARRAAIESAANELEAWLGGVRVTPRFRTPLERELSAEAAG